MQLISSSSFIKYILSDLFRFKIKALDVNNNIPVPIICNFSIVFTKNI